MKTISLIIPFHDEENEIKIMLDGLVDWSKLPDEIIVINTCYCVNIYWIFLYSFLNP